VHISLIKWCFIIVYTNVKYLVVTFCQQTETYFSYFIEIQAVDINIYNVTINLKPSWYVRQNSLNFYDIESIEEYITFS
jgi:hypothetical protein